MTAFLNLPARIVAAVSSLLLVAALTVSAQALPVTTIHVTTESGQHDITVEWAVTPDERERGLMERRTMADDHGMIFDFTTEQPVFFWMKDTPLSLDMVFVKSDGTVSRIERQATPFSEAVIPGGAPVRYVIELVGGEAARLKLQPGNRFTIVPPR